MVRDEIVDYIDGSSRPSMRRCGKASPCRASSATPQRGFALETTRRSPSADQVVIAAGGYQIPIVPRWPSGCPATMCSSIPRPIATRSSCPTARCWWWAAGQSGCQIAEDLHLAGRKVHLCVGDAPRCRPALSRQGRGRVAAPHGLLRSARARASLARGRARQDQSLRHRPRRRARHRSAPARVEGMELSAACWTSSAIASYSTTTLRNASTRPTRCPKASRPASTASSPSAKSPLRRNHAIGPSGYLHGSGRSSIIARPASPPSSGASDFAPITAGSICRSSTGVASRRMCAA